MKFQFFGCHFGHTKREDATIIFNFHYIRRLFETLIKIRRLPLLFLTLASTNTSTDTNIQPIPIFLLLHILPLILQIMCGFLIPSTKLLLDPQNSIPPFFTAEFPFFLLFFFHFGRKSGLVEVIVGGGVGVFGLVERIFENYGVFGSVGGFVMDFERFRVLGD